MRKLIILSLTVLLSAMLLGGCSKSKPKAKTDVNAANPAAPGQAPVPGAPLAVPAGQEPYKYPNGTVTALEDDGFKAETTDPITTVIDWYKKQFPDIEWSDPNQNDQQQITWQQGYNSKASLYVSIRDKSADDEKLTYPAGTIIKVWPE